MKKEKKNDALKNASAGKTTQIIEEEKIRHELKTHEQTTRDGNSEELLPAIAQGVSKSMSLVDASVMQMMTLIDYCENEVRRDDKNELRVSAKTINAAANCAREIRGLIKLKVDLFKEVRKK